MKAIRQLAFALLLAGAWAALPATLAMSDPNAPTRLQSGSHQPSENDNYK